MAFVLFLAWLVLRFLQHMLLCEPNSGVVGMWLRELRAPCTWGHMLIYRLAIFSLSQQIAFFAVFSVFSQHQHENKREHYRNSTRVCVRRCLDPDHSTRATTGLPLGSVYPGPGQVTAKRVGE